MNRYLAAAMASLAAVVLVGCSRPSSTPSVGGQAPAGVAATLGGVEITLAELDEAAKSQLQKIDTEIYQIRKRALEGLIDDKLVAEAAKKKGMSVEKFMAEEVDAKVAAPSEEEMKALYDSSKDRLGKSYDEVKGQIADYLTTNRKMRAKADLMASLREGSEVKISLEPPRMKIDIEDAEILGEKGARIQLVEFSDYQCPFCKRVRPTIWRLMDEYKGKISYAFLDFPLSFHKEAKKAHEAAHCAGDQGKYYDYNKKIFDNQAKLGVDALKGYAKELGLKADDFDKCLSTDKYAKRVEENIRIGAGAGVTGTPAFFINGILLSGAQPYDSFKEIIESELKR